MRTKRERHLAAPGYARKLLLGVAGVLALGALLVPGSSLARGQAAPTSTASPEILGTTVVGNMVAATSGSWSGSNRVSVGYRWLACPANADSANGVGCQTIGGAHGAFYRIRLGNLGSRLRVRVSASNSA